MRWSDHGIASGGRWDRHSRSRLQSSNQSVVARWPSEGWQLPLMSTGETPRLWFKKFTYNRNPQATRTHWLQGFWWA